MRHYKWQETDSKQPDKPFFQVENLGFSNVRPLPSNDELPAYTQDKRDVAQHHENINNVLERWMARATLRFPSNTLGQEMSKLGVASTENSSGHYWNELSPTCFQLVWTKRSGSPLLTVTSSYRDWWGLRLRDRILLLPLWIVLSFWLMIVVNKIFFTGIEDITFDTVDWRHVNDINKNLLVLERAKAGRAQWIKVIADLPPESHLDMRLELKRRISDKSYQPSYAGSVIILDYFEFNLKDRKYNQARLELLENLLLDSTRKLVLVSTIDLLFFLNQSAPQVLSESGLMAQPLLDRWADVLSRFTKVQPFDLTDNEFRKALELFDKNVTGQGHSNDRHQFADWIRQECDCTTRLRNIGPSESLQRQGSSITRVGSEQGPGPGRCLLRGPLVRFDHQ